MASVRKSGGGGSKATKSGSGEKKRSATTESHGAARLEPSNVTQHDRDERAKKKKQGR